MASLDVPDDYAPIIAHLNEASVPTRYPEDITVLSKSYDRSAAYKYLEATKRLLKWIKIKVG